MRTHRFITSLLLLVLAVLGAPARVEGQETERFTRVVRLGKDGTLDLSNVAGTIKITGGAGDAITIDALKRTRVRSDAVEQLKRVAIEVTEVPGRVEVRTVYPRRRQTTVSVDYIVTVPRASAVNVKSVSGTITLTRSTGSSKAFISSSRTPWGLWVPVQTVRPVSVHSAAAA